MLGNIFWTMMQIGGIFVLSVGLITVGSWFLELLPPADQSNRFNRLRLWWFASSAPHRFIGYYPEHNRIWLFKEVIMRPHKFIDIFPWLGGDEKDNLANPGAWNE